MRLEFSSSTVLMTHSAWIDFALGLGFPGILLLWFAIFGITYQSYLAIKSPVNQNSCVINQTTHFSCFSLIPLLSIWLIVGIFLFWIIGEVSERIFIENYYFFLAFFLMAISKSKKFRIVE